MHSGNRLRRPVLAASVLLVLPAVPALAPAAQAAQTAPERARTAPAAAAQAAKCGTGSAVEQKMRGGGVWRMCWHTDSTSGLVLEDISFQPRHEAKPITILKSAKLGQIHVPYDNAAAEYNDVTDMQLGESAEALRPKDCPGGVLMKIPGVDPDTGETKQVNGLCVTTQERGFAFHGNSGDIGEEPGKKDAEQGQDLVLYTVNSAGYYHYINQWNFSDDGTITPKAGATGNLSPSDYDASDKQGWPVGKGSKDRATSHHHNIFWRLNFKPDGSSDAKVEQFDTKYAGKGQEGIPTYRTTRKRLAKETAGNTGANGSRWWRVVSAKGKNADGHRRSWEIVHRNQAKYTARAFTKYDVYFTRYKKFEQYASDNARFGSHRADDVGKFTNGEALKHPVTWVNVGFHHIARDEDQTPMPVHWQGFSVAPRDVTSMSPLTPDRLRKPKYNGEPEEADD
ncbi:copper amine oxidase [Streptomyces sp. NBC_01795]|uniref:copper amine oxidase n=1 Tax=Streptomyces sp. NBC_01795 TaxID=2975943 RepID=UPI002DD82B51|nr:copper amine oxidase [Streptomyces sp. NBC_01795]WSA95223.1 copper amine oxidase [Streptomyces sp. NBC_01795]